MTTRKESVIARVCIASVLIMLFSPDTEASGPLVAGGYDEFCFNRCAHRVPGARNTRSRLVLVTDFAPNRYGSSAAETSKDCLYSKRNAGANHDVKLHKDRSAS